MGRKNEELCIKSGESELTGVKEVAVVGWEECPVGFICLVALISTSAVCSIINDRMYLLIIQIIDGLIHQLFLLLHQ